MSFGLRDFSTADFTWSTLRGWGSVITFIVQTIKNTIVVVEQGNLLCLVSDVATTCQWLKLRWRTDWRKPSDSRKSWPGKTLAATHYNASSIPSQDPTISPPVIVCSELFHSKPAESQNRSNSVYRSSLLQKVLQCSWETCFWWRTSFDLLSMTWNPGKDPDVSLHPPDFPWCNIK